ncbi:cysteine desulfurase family protein [Gordonia crocea]|uniref:Cysteine desulfurase n=1 Tax=Gordonia crocea TaxID=589162 RepID=A0A7I9UZS5_9ACTN|nr:cysteine desulfurase family protein [Gordonia crocea]GED98371.1 cysteine desulfurase [Gordonia crocea]
MPTAPVESIYLDNAASMAMRPEAVAAMVPLLSQAGNPSSLHAAGRGARRHLEEARESIAADLGARPSEVVFTAGGTEADNLAVVGIAAARRTADPRRRRVVISAVEHHAVLDPAQALVDDGFELVIIGVDGDGALDLDALCAEVAQHADEIAVISVMWANNEVGTVQPVIEVAALGRENGIPVHSDAIAAAGHLAVDFGESGLSALSVAGHKFGGPQGVGALLLGRDVAVTPLVRGGGHERDLRSGTQNVAGAVGMAAGLSVATANLVDEARAVTALRDRLFDRLLTVNGAQANGDREHRLPGNVHVSFAGCEGDSLLMLLDAQRVECSTGSACTAGVAQASHVLLAMGLPMSTARGSLRFSLSHTTTEAEVDRVGEVIVDAVDRARAAGLVALAGGRR